MFYPFTIAVSLFFLARINQINGIQCYKCSCTVIPGESTCTEANELQCVVEHVENNYCFITRSSNNLQLGHLPNSDLMFLESLHYIRVKEEISYLENTSTWQAPIVVDLAYGCDWNLCNTPRILSLLPNGLTYAVNSKLLTDTLIGNPNEPLVTCLSCTKCVNASTGLNCLTPNCSGTCYIDDHLDDPVRNNGSCLFAFESLCLAQKLTTAVQLTGTYYIDDDIFGITEIDIWCRVTNCNDPTHIQIIQRNTTYSTQINDQLYFRPEFGSTTPTTPINGLLGCYVCHCERQIGTDACKILECTIEYKNASYCEIARNIIEIPGREIIDLGHVDRKYVPYNHFIYVVEELILNRNLSWNPSSISQIAYVCDWELCNDGRLVDKLITSFRFNAASSVIAGFLQSSEPLTYCFNCSICSNSSDFSQCGNASCAQNGRCFIEQYVDDPQFDDCQYAFRADCQASATDTSVIISATFSIDDDKLDIDQVDVYCAKNGCNRPETVYSLINLIDEDISLDSLFYIRPVENSTSLPTITEPIPSSTMSPTPGSATSNSITTTFLFFISCMFVVFYH